MGSRAGLRQRLACRANELVRLGMVHLLSGPLPLYVVNEFPKSGGTWVGQMLGRALGVPFPRNRFPALRPSIMHGHYLRPWGIKNVVVVWRDGRDVMVSWYHQQLIPHGLNELQVERSRRELPLDDYGDVRRNLPAFIEYAFTRPHDPAFSWSEFVRRWRDRKDAVHVRYEDLLRDTPGELRRVFRELTGERLSAERASAIAEEFSFERQARRRPGQEDRGSFLRKGVAGDWRNYFGPEARRVFDRYAGEELILLGYERDRSWV
ncbi:sulfotransferase domain-containing protein [Rubrobacter xylanophilus]|uniref:sulfotransferase domain-containing protein n=1 Tax=Rubrobacter xylanophilus TaxID=49319 RepID=UPI00003A21F0|nr:sulfotransferase domain-containing protein [Rubrobacter xylanophilus]